MRDPVLAGVLSLIVPGVGQLYNGRILAGILWLIFTPGFWLGTGGTLGWVCHIVFEDYLSVLLPRGTWSGM